MATQQEPHSTPASTPEQEIYYRHLVQIERQDRLLGQLQTRLAGGLGAALFPDHMVAGTGTI